jgi:hypothetical protein
MKLIAGAALAFSCSGAFAAAGLDADVSAYYVNQDFSIDSDSVDGDGFGLSANVLVPLAQGGIMIPLEYNKTELDLGSGIDLEVEEIRAGLGYMAPINPTLSVYGGARYINLDLKVDGFGSDTADGYGIFGGAKAHLGTIAQAYAEVSYVDLEDEDGGDADGPEFTIGVSADWGGPGLFAEYRLLRLEDSDNSDFDLDSFHIGARFTF